MEIQVYTCGLVSTNSYFVNTEEGGALIDAPDGIGRFVRSLKKEGCTISSVLLTHGHFDHIMGVSEVLAVFPEAKVYLSMDDMYLLDENKDFLRYFGIPLTLYSIPPKERFIPLSDSIGPFKVIKTPGHTNGSVSFLLEDTLFSGDTLFEGGEGRTDLGGDYDFLRKSLLSLMEMKNETIVLPGHGGRTTIERERKRLAFTRL